MAKGVEAELLSNEKYDITNLLEKFISLKGQIYACGTCIKVRNKNATELCPMSSMSDLYDIISESDKIISF